MDNSRLVLGTAQLGMPYGIANRIGQPDYREALHIVQTAWDCGIRIFDTAQGYGCSEAVLAEVLKNLNVKEKASVCTKLDPSLNLVDPAAVRRSLEHSSKLFGSSLHCLMLHREDSLQFWSVGLGDLLREYRAQGLYSSIGISVYDPPSARRALETEGIDLVQLPANLVDRRHDQEGVFVLARSVGKVVMIRSVFLQGALLLPVDRLPEQIKHVRPFIEQLTKTANRSGIPPRELALGFVRDRWPDCQVVFGAESAEQVQENLNAWGNDLPLDVFQELDNKFRNVPLEVVRPDLWDGPKPMAVGKNIRLRRIRPSDAWGEYVNWMNDPSVTRFLESRFRSYTSKDLEDYILDQRRNPAVLFLAIEEIGSGRHIGNIKIGPKHPVHNTAELGFLIGAKECWGKGFATEAIGLSLELAFNVLSVRKIIAGCYSGNVASQKAFKKNKFVCEGVSKEHVLDGQHLADVINFGILRKSWQENKASISLDSITNPHEA